MDGKDRSLGLNSTEAVDNPETVSEEWKGVQGMDGSVDGSFKERVAVAGEVSRGKTGVFGRRTACL